jgi:glycerol uptake facilitator-like aquaporin
VYHGELICKQLGWALGLMIALYATLNISGGHLNPAISLALVVFRKFPLLDFFGSLQVVVGGGVGGWVLGVGFCFVFSSFFLSFHPM